MIKEFYRYEIDNTLESVRIELRTFEFFKETPTGYWIKFKGYSHSMWKKWIPKISKKRYAYPTKKEAKINFIRRTERRFQILSSQKIVCRIALENVDDLIRDGEKYSIPEDFEY